ncbi:MAG: hypothetical protein U1G05_08260 [Kiritimatiellia bacterium]
MKDSERALQLLHTAAAKDGCDWIRPVEGPELELSHLSKARALASAALARACAALSRTQTAPSPTCATRSA